MKARILLVDDSGLARRSVRHILETAGYDVVEAEDGMSALERYFLEKPDLVLLDLVMQRNVRVWTCWRSCGRWTRARGSIVVSADIQTRRGRWPRAAARAASSTKPVDRGEILKVVADVLGATT